MAWLMAAHAADDLLFEQFPLARVHQDAEVVCIGNQKATLAVERQTAGFSRFDVRSSPAAEELAVCREDLNAARHIDDVDLVVLIDGHSAGLLESPIAETALAPNFIGFCRRDLAVVTARQEQREANQRPTENTAHEVMIARGVLRRRAGYRIL